MVLSSGSNASEAVKLCVFDLRRGQNEGEELDKILFFHPADLPFTTQLSVIGLSEGLITFTRLLLGRSFLHVYFLNLLSHNYDAKLHATKGRKFWPWCYECLNLTCFNSLLSLFCWSLSFFCINVTACYWGHLTQVSIPCELESLRDNWTLSSLSLIVGLDWFGLAYPQQTMVSCGFFFSPSWPKLQRELSV